MNFLEKLLEKKDEKDTTYNIFLGAPESEAESTDFSRMHLEDVFITNEKVINDLAYEKFIVLGKKGTGKSAIANYLKICSLNDANLFCSFIKKNNIDLEQSISTQYTSSLDIGIIFKWTILYKLLSLLIENTRIEHEKGVGFLKKFLNKNSSFCEFDTFKITEFISHSNAEIQIDAIKKYAQIKGMKGLDTKREKMPFFEVIPKLEEIAKALLNTIEQYHDETSYFIFFDDLDNDYKIDDKKSNRDLLSLLRIAKEFNTSTFAHFGKTTVKIVLLLRDDIKSSLMDNADTAKLFSSYSTKISWYNEKELRDAPDNTLIKQFIDKRIEKACNAETLKNNFSKKIKNWEDLITVPFKTVLDLTFYTPRDLILFLSPITEKKYKIPLSLENIEELNEIYCDSIVNELRNAFSIYYEKNEIDILFDILKDNLWKDDATFSKLKELCKEKQIDGDKAIHILFDNSIIGLKVSNYIYFKHREKEEESLASNIDETSVFTLHKALKTYFYKHRHSYINVR